MSVIVAAFKAKMGSEEELKNALRSLIAHVQKEEGTRVYTLHQNEADKSRFLFYEVYQNNDALEYHRSQSYVKQVLNSIGDLLEEKPVIDLYEIIASVDR